MTGLRWTLGVVATLFAAGWALLVAVAGGFRRSFGASETGWWVGVVPVVAAALALASVVWPERRALLHATAVAMAALLGACVWVARDAPFVATLGVLYVAAWGLFYYHAVRGGGEGAAGGP